MEKLIRNEKETLYNDLRSKIIIVTEQELVNKSIIERKAYAEAAFFLMNKVTVQEDDIFAGKLEKYNCLNMYPRNIEQELDYLEESHCENVQEYRSMITARDIGLFTRAPGAHAIPAYDVLVQKGIQNYIDRIRSCMVHAGPEQKHFYAAELIVLCAMQERILKYAKEAGKCYETCGQKNIKRIKEACEWIAYNKPRDLYEAIQLILLAHEHVLAEARSGSISFGRLDQYLYPFYKRDLSKKKKGSLSGIY